MSVEKSRSTVNFVSIPQELKQNASFCVWRKEKRNGRLTKVPYNPQIGQMAKTNEPDTFSNFATAMKAYAMGGYDGIGIRVSDGIGAIDIDHCIREDGTLNDVAASVLGIFKDAYFERSPSGTGLRGFFKLDSSFAYDKTVYYINNRKYGLEVYLPGTTNRFVTVTGNEYRSGTVTLDMEALQSILNTFMKRKNRVENTQIEPCSYLTDEQVVAHALRSESAEKFKALYEGKWEELYDSQSDADMAFVSMLSFWCGCVEEQIDRIFRSSGLMRDKWDRMTGDATYGQITIRNAVSSARAIYLPIYAGDINAPDKEFSDLDNGNIQDDRSVLEEKAGFRPDLSKITLTLEEMQPNTNPRYGREEIGIGNAFADYFKPIARFDRDRCIWYVYDGKVWQPDEAALAVAELAKLLADKLYTYALQIKDEDARNRYIKRVQKLQLRKNRRTMVEDAKSVFPVPHKIFDRNYYLFNCKNGTLDLKTMEFREHAPEDFLTLMAGISYEPEAVCPRWEQFVAEVMCNDKELAGYLQRTLGYALTGDTSMECMFILYGATSRNGKGTTMETFLKIMGDYGKTSNPELLAAKFGMTASSSGPTEEVARLAGARFVNISEPEKKITFNAALVKRLTGNDTITARFLHENSFEFTTTFKIFINTNYLPNVADMAMFDSGRLNIIPFKRHFSEAEQDKHLKTFFSKDENLSAIFNWCLEGYRQFKMHHLERPEAVKTATEEYRKDSDRYAQFAESWLEDGNDEDGCPFEVSTMAAYRMYTKWCAEYRYNSENYKNFRSAMEKRYRLELKRPKAGGEKCSLIIGCRLLKEERGKEEMESEALTPVEDEFCKLM